MPLKRGADAYRGQILWANDRRFAFICRFNRFTTVIDSSRRARDFIDDALALERKARAAGVEVTCEV